MSEHEYLLETWEGRSLFEIALEVCQEFQVSMVDLKSNRRSRYIAWPRQVFMSRAKNETTASLPEIGRFLGGRDHSTISHGIKRVQERERLQQKVTP